MTRLSVQRAFTLYGLVVAFVFVAFVLGLLIGTGSVEREYVRPAGSSYEPVENLENQLDFYEELSKPIEKVQRETPVVILERGSKPPPEPAVESEKPRTAAGRDSEKPFTIQVAAHSTREEAEQLLIRLGTRSFEGRIREPDISSGDKFFRVWVGQFSSMDEAETFAGQLKEEGFHTYVRKIH